MKVNWDESVCIHSGKCVENLPTVFKIEDGKFVIDENGASEEAIRETVSKCPSGALSCQ